MIIGSLFFVRLEQKVEISFQFTLVEPRSKFQRANGMVFYFYKLKNYNLIYFNYHFSRVSHYGVGGGNSEPYDDDAIIKCNYFIEPFAF